MHQEQRGREGMVEWPFLPSYYSPTLVFINILSLDSTSLCHLISLFVDIRVFPFLYVRCRVVGAASLSFSLSILFDLFFVRFVIIIGEWTICCSDII